MEVIARELSLLDSLKGKDTTIVFGAKKMFAVIQDIEVGDKAYVDQDDRHNPRGFGTCVSTTKEHKYCQVNVNGRTSKYLLKNTLKILGEISPDAAYVKDGDKVEIKTWNPPHIEGDRVEFSLSNGKNYVKLLCPTCKNYH